MWTDFCYYEKVTLNILEHRSFHVYANLSEILRNGIAGSKSVCLFSFARHCQSFHQRCTSTDNVGQVFIHILANNIFTFPF